MKIVMRCLAVLLALVALAVAGAGVYAAFHYRNAPPILLKPSQEAGVTVQAMLEAVEQGDYDRASALILGAPELGIDRQPEDALGKLLWNAYQDSLEFTPMGECYTTESGLAYDYQVRFLDWDSVMEPLRSRAMALLEQRVAEAEDMSEVYDENNEYLESFVMDVMVDAVAQGLQEDGTCVEARFTVNLVYQDGKWWIVADDALLSAISGGLAG